MTLLQKIQLLTATAIVVFSAASRADENYSWDSLAIGGGGFVSAVVPSTTERGLVYARTDVGGAYRWDKTRERWIPLTDWVSEEQTGLLGVESIALDPQDSAKVYMMAGISYFNGGKSAVLRSSDYGKTFSVIDVTSQFKINGNGMGRSNGERLQVDPANSNILYAGTRANGLFKSTDAGATWARLGGLEVTATPNQNGVSFVLLDAKSATGGGVQKIYAGISRFPSLGSNLYLSSDGGLSFSAIPGGPEGLMPQRAAMAKDGNLFITYANGAGPHANEAVNEPMDKGQVWKFSPASNSWSNVTPSGVSKAFGGISVDPNNAKRLVLSTINNYQLQYGNSAYGDRIFISHTGGESWVDVVQRGFAMDNKGVSWLSGHALHWVGCLAFDPFDSKTVWATSGNGIFKTGNIDAAPTQWAFTVAGLEETVPLNLISLVGGPLVSAIADYDGFRHTDSARYAPIHTPQMGSTTGLAVAALDNNIMARSGDNKLEIYYSTDKGLSWTKTAKMMAKGGHLALSADGKTLVHSPKDSTQSYYSADWGASWTAISGLSLKDARPVADPVNKNTFYALNGSRIMVSRNGGASFAAAGNLPAGGGSTLIRLAPEREGDMWVALYTGGLARSTNSGASFSTVAGVSYAGAVGFGKAAAGASYPTVYIWGTVGGVRGVFRSVDSGASWVRINDKDHQYGGPGNGQLVLGDMNNFGVVYMSTAGRGIAYGKPAASPAPTGTLRAQP